MSLKVLSSGIFTTLQDRGRYGYSDEGRSSSGVMDEYAYFWSQKLLNNQNANALEVMVGLKLKALASTMISVTGADLTFSINGVVQAIWQTHLIEKDDVLFFEKRVSGQRAYLAVKGGFLCPKIYGSVSTTLKENIGSRVQRGDTLKFLALNSGSKSIRFRTASKAIPDYTKPLTLRLLLSYQEACFSQEEKEKFFSSDYGITLQSDRMGFKLEGQAIRARIGGIISEGIAFGSVQIPKDGQPIVLLKERQTIGGYPKIGTVLPIDCFKLAQASIGSMVRFETIEIEEAQEIMRKFYKAYFALLT
jgi:biotin-dependent carboxylase-like uncharacterized protein